MPRAELQAPINPEGSAEEQAAAASQSTRVRRAVARGLGRRRCCRGDGLRAGVTLLAVVAAVSGVAVLSHTLAGSRYTGPPPPPPAPCGSWDGVRHLGPGDHPCGKCLYGVEVSKYKVSADDLSGPHTSGPCDTLAARFGVPQFEIFNRNKSTSCCENPRLEVDDLVDICKAPTLAQWRAEGHPRKAPEKVVFSYIGSVGGALAPMPTWGGSCSNGGGACINEKECKSGGACENNKPLPDSINVAVIGPVDDTTNNQGIFRIAPPTKGVGGFAGNCSMQIDPQRAGRGDGGDADSRRLWLGTLLPLQPGFHDNGNWCKGLRRPHCTPPDEWGRNAAESLEKVFLRYRLDGLDMNIEVPPDHPSATEFASYICSMWRQLEARMGPGLTFTVTPYSLSWDSGIYQAVADECLDLMAWANWQTYNDYSGHTLRHPQYTERAAKVFGWDKTTWGMSTQHGSQRPLASAAVQIAEQYPDARGVFVWTAESSAKCTPAWCTEDVVAAQISGEPLPFDPKSSSACRC